MSQEESSVGVKVIVQEFDPLFPSSLPAPDSNGCSEGLLADLVNNKSSSNGVESAVDSIKLPSVSESDVTENHQESESKSTSAPEPCTETHQLLLDSKPASSVDHVSTDTPYQDTTIPVTMTSPQEPLPTFSAPTVPMDTGVTSQTILPTVSPKKKKKKKHKRRSSEKAVPRSHVTSSAKSTSDHMTTEQITSQMNEIDSFLQSLKVGGLGNIHAQPPPPSMPLPPNLAVTTTTTPQTSSAPEANRNRSMGMKLISELGSGSSSEDSSSDSESSSSDSSDDRGSPVTLATVNEQESEDEDSHKKDGSKKYGYPMIKNELHYRDIPPLESCDLPFPEGGELVVVGVVSHITEELVVIQAYPGTPAVDEGTVLWSDQKKSLSVVFEIFGPVKSPYYSVHVHSPEHAHSMGLTPGTVIHIVRGNSELTKYVFTQQLLQQRGTDASWKDDTEVPVALQDYSDDEKEMKNNKSKRLGKRKEKTTPTSGVKENPTHQAPRPSRDPKMRAYFPPGPSQHVVRNPPPVARPGAMYGQHPLFPPHGGVAYTTPGGFLGYRPPTMYRPPPQVPTAPAIYPPYSMGMPSGTLPPSHYVNVPNGPPPFPHQIMPSGHPLPPTHPADQSYPPHYAQHYFQK